MKTILFAFALTIFTVAVQAQVHNAVPVCHVSGDPDLIAKTIGQNQLIECTVAKDTTNGTLYIYDGTQPSGSRWNPVSMGTDTDTRLANPIVDDNNLQFDILDVVNNTVIGSVSIPINTIAPVQSVIGTNDITVTSLNNIYTVDFTEAITSLTYTPATNTLAYTDENGDVSTFDVTTSLQADGDITLTGTGTAGDPYIVSFTQDTTTLTFAGTILTFTNESGVSSTIDLATLKDGVITGLTFTGTGATRNYTVTRSEGLPDITGTININDADSVATNEIQTLSTAAGVNAGTTTLSLAGGSFTVEGAAVNPVEVSVSGSTYTLGLPSTLPLYIGNAAAITGGLAVGDWYQCDFGSTECTKGDLRQVY